MYSFQLLKERGNLPQYGSCWKSAVEHVHNGCRFLSEETQSDIALHLTNCFLEMSGHATYNCELDKKPNLKGICINSMTDRAFNVYTEFYTHTQNICWFLKGQVWHEMISENTFRVGKQLEDSARNQEILLKNQEESIVLQEKIMQYSHSLEKILGDFYVFTQNNQKILNHMLINIKSLQSWLVGEISWFSSIIFYCVCLLSSLILTSTKRTNSARLPLFIFIILSIFIESFVSSLLDKSENPQNFNLEYYFYIWCYRKIFLFISLLFIAASVYLYKDYVVENNSLLKDIQLQNLKIFEVLSRILKTNDYNKSSLIYESETERTDLLNKVKNYKGGLHEVDAKYKNGLSFDDKQNSFAAPLIHTSPVFNKADAKKNERDHFSEKQTLNNVILTESFRYNLRSSSRQSTPITNV